MALTSELANPTPWMVKIPYERGIKITVPAFGKTSLTLQQLDDFRGGKPGSEAVDELLNYHGLFVIDSNRSYDHQAVEALRKCKDAKKAQYDAAIKSLSSQRAAAGVHPDAEAFKESTKQMGLDALKDQIETLNDQIKKYEGAIEKTPDNLTRKKLDPTRTVFVMDPPTEFPSVAAMEFFLSRPENKELHDQHLTYMKALSEEQPEVS